MESLGDWAWPGRAAPAEALPMPPAWVPAHPPSLASGALEAPLRQRRLSVARSLLIALLLLALAGVSGALALKHELPLQTPPNARVDQPSAPARIADTRDAIPLPTLARVSEDGAGSTIDRASFPSSALRSEGSFLVYLPPGYASTEQRYPVLYLLHGRNGHATAFLEVGIQEDLDRLIARKEVPPMIAVMIQDRSGLNNWRDIGTRHSAGYVTEVQELVDRMLPTIPRRWARAIAGSSMGGFGAMHVALANPYRFSVVESWLGFFDNLERELRADRRAIERLGLHAFLYGASEDPVAVPAEDPWFAGLLRSAGAQAHSAIYPGGHSLQKVSEYLETGLLFAAHSLRAAQRRAAIEERAARGAVAVAGARPPLAPAPRAGRRGRGTS